ncbi:MAG: EamA family transporter [Proteobacteria bacterium]|nr:EamA family transporter [Pseudomonadota bacterium]
MGEIWGILAAVLSSGLGGTAVGATRYVVGASDPLAIGAFRFGIGFVFLLPLAAGRRARWPPRSDWPAVMALGLLFFGLFPILFNASLIFTTAARAALALSTLPLLTMAVAAGLRVEPLTRRKSVGVLIAMAGVAVALLTGLASAPAGAWRGDLLMVGAAFCMALYNVWSKPLIRRSGPLPFTAMGMGAGALSLAIVSWVRGGFAAAARFDGAQWLAIAYLGIFGAAIIFFLWSYALERTTPTRVAISVTVNPVTASLVGAALLGEPIHWNLVLGLATVLVGILLASTRGRRADAPVTAAG